MQSASVREKRVLTNTGYAIVVATPISTVMQDAVSGRPVTTNPISWRALRRL